MQEEHRRVGLFRYWRGTQTRTAAAKPPEVCGALVAAQPTTYKTRSTAPTPLHGRAAWNWNGRLALTLSF